ncbi:hypothetical protein [uncultured Cellulomonas sp.]|uniref:hypothetical protein n=1 Tax=uncultured Cellulomonas sp. TaxID=189682 RepID=UPI002634493F|nr:hypothetical protein [uncultured Cellulomonas sp.]
MKRTLVTAAAAALLLGGCATGETGHLDPEIYPELAAPLAAGETVAGQVEPDVDDEPDQDQQEAGDDGVNVEVVDAFNEAAEEQSWYAEIIRVDVAGESVVVSTRLLPGDPAVLQVCDTASAVGERLGLTSLNVEVVDIEDTVLSGRAAGDEECAVALS